MKIQSMLTATATCPRDWCHKSHVRQKVFNDKSIVNLRKAVIFQCSAVLLCHWIPQKMNLSQISPFPSSTAGWERPGQNKASAYICDPLTPCYQLLLSGFPNEPIASFLSKYPQLLTGAHKVRCISRHRFIIIRGRLCKTKQHVWMLDKVLIQQQQLFSFCQALSFQPTHTISHLCVFTMVIQWEREGESQGKPACQHLWLISRSTRGACCFPKASNNCP